MAVSIERIDTLRSELWKHGATTTTAPAATGKILILRHLCWVVSFGVTYTMCIVSLPTTAVQPLKHPILHCNIAPPLLLVVCVFFVFVYTTWIRYHSNCWFFFISLAEKSFTSCINLLLFAFSLGIFERCRWWHFIEIWAKYEGVAHNIDYYGISNQIPYYPETTEHTHNDGIIWHYITR